MQNLKIGVIIPIYNVAKYLRECLDSVLHQSYQNFEVVLVNDGSTDGMSLQIALSYTKNDARFILIDKQNGGQASARNAGIAYFAGELALQSIDNRATERERERERVARHAVIFVFLCYESLVLSRQNAHKHAKIFIKLARNPYTITSRKICHNAQMERVA